MSIPPHRPDLYMSRLVSKSSDQRCQVSVAASQVREEEEMRGKMEWLWQVSWWLWERKGVGIKAQAVILLCSLQRDNLLKWGMDLKSKWVDPKPLGHYPPASVCVIASTPTMIDSLCHCLIMVWLFFPGTEKLNKNIAVGVGVEMCPEMWLLNVNRWYCCRVNKIQTMTA